MFLEELFFEIGFILVIAAGLSFIVYRLKQPLIIAYIIAGILAGPSVFALAKSPEVFDVLSQFGVAFLLFTVGLGLNWRTIKEVGGIAFATGAGQVLFTSVVGYLIGVSLGFDVLTSVYLAVAFAFSSTIIIIKLLMDKGDLDSLYGRISVGFLLVQDFIAMLILLGLGAFQGGASIEGVVVATVIKVIILVPILWFISAKIVPRLVAYAAKSQELLLIFAVAWCFLIAGILVWFGFGVELGALIAGVMLSGTVYEREINARIRPLRDFFLIIFFIVLGTQLEIGSFAETIVPTILFSLFILIGNPLIVLLIMRALGYHPRTGFLAGTTVAQISEFSFIVIAAGVVAGHVDSSALALAAAVGLLTIAGSSYLIEWNEQIYDFFKPIFRFLIPRRSNTIPIKKEPRAKVMMFGFHRIAGSLLKTIRKMDEPYLIVDFDPQVVRELNDVGEKTVYGDVGDDVFLGELGAHRANFIISTIPDVVISLSILSYLRSKRFKGTVIVSARSQYEAEQCYKAGATYVIVPDILGGTKLNEMLQKKKTSKKSWKTVGKRDLDKILQVS